MVEIIAPMTIKIGAGPSSMICASVIRAPRRATPRRRTVREPNCIPLLVLALIERKKNAMPSNNAYSSVGQP